MKVSPESNLDSIQSIFQGPGPDSSTFTGLLVESGYASGDLDQIWIWFPGHWVQSRFGLQRLDLNSLAIRNVSEAFPMSVV